MKDKLLKKFHELRKHPFSVFILFGFVSLLIPLFAPVIGVTIVDALAKTLIYYVVALGFSLLIGYAGLASLGTAAFVGIGTFSLYTGMQVFNLPFIVSIALAIAIAIVVGSIFGFVSLRIEGMYLAIVTLGLSEIAVELFKNFPRFTGGVSGQTFVGISLFGLRLSNTAVWILIIAFVVLAMILTYNLINSPTGRAMLAIKNSESAAQAMGISVIKYRLTAFVVSTVYAVIGGVLYMSYVKFSIGTHWSLAISLNILAAVVVGGSKSIWGVLIGTFIIFGLDLAVFKSIPFLMQSQYANVSFIISGILIIVVMMYFPNGIIGLINKLIYKIKAKRLAKNSKVEV
ncbi:MAG: branched-chain amino acid ABC transporter permease [Acholeplasmataceae bacterium]